MGKIRKTNRMKWMDFVNINKTRLWINLDVKNVVNNGFTHPTRIVATTDKIAFNIRVVSIITI